MSYVRELLGATWYLWLQGVLNFPLWTIFCCFVGELFGRGKRAIEITLLLQVLVVQLYVRRGDLLFLLVTSLYTRRIILLILVREEIQACLILGLTLQQWSICCVVLEVPAIPLKLSELMCWLFLERFNRLISYRLTNRLAFVLSQLVSTVESLSTTFSKLCLWNLLQRFVANRNLTFNFQWWLQELCVDIS